MSEDHTSSDRDKSEKSWLEKLGQLFQGELKDREQLHEVLYEARKNNLIDADAFTMIDGVMQVADMQVRDIMIPRSQMIAVEMEATAESILNTVIESAHSRFPVVGDSRDEVVGILLAKDLLPYFTEGMSSKLNVRDILRPAVFIPESKRLNVLLKEFRSSRNHIAIVVDEYGGVAGLVTIEDVLEQIVGDIEDEHDFEDDIYIYDHSPGHATVKAITPIDEFNEHFRTDFSDDEFDTIGGLVLNAFGHLPKRGETVELGNIHFRILRASSRRIHLMEASYIEAGESSAPLESVGAE